MTRKAENDDDTFKVGDEVSVRILGIETKGVIASKIVSGPLTYFRVRVIIGDVGTFILTLMPKDISK